MADVCHEWKQLLTSNLFYLLKTLNTKLDIIRFRLCSRTASHHQHNGCVCPSEMFLLWHFIVEIISMKLGQKVFFPSQTNVLQHPLFKSHKHTHWNAKPHNVSAPKQPLQRPSGTFVKYFMSCEGTICAWHTLERVVRGDKNVYMLVHATSHINEQRFRLLCCSFCWLCLKKQTWTHTRLPCVFVNSAGSHVWNCHGGGRVGGCGVSVVLELHFNRTDAWEHVGGDIWWNFPWTCEIISLFFFY